MPNIDERMPSEESKLYNIVLSSASVPLIVRYSRVSEQVLLEPLKRSCHSILQCEFWPPQRRLTVNIKGYGLAINYLACLVRALNNFRIASIAYVCDKFCQIHVCDDLVAGVSCTMQGAPDMWSQVIYKFFIKIYNVFPVRPGRNDSGPRLLS